MATHHRPQLRSKLLSSSPDPMKSSILRESNMGWSSPPTSSLDNDKSTGLTSATSPLRISKRESSPNLRTTQADLARRSSSSYRHMRNNNLVSKSPFKSQIPTSTPSSRPSIPYNPNASVSFPTGTTISVTRRVSGEKRPRPASMHDEAENENDRPVSLKRDRKQSKAYQVIIEKEPVTKSPFRQQLQLQLQRKPSPPLPPTPAPTQSLLNPTYSSPSRDSPSPARPSLVTKRMHGPRVSGAIRNARRKTVKFDENCDVLEFRDPDTSGEIDDEDVYGRDEDDDQYKDDEDDMHDDGGEVMDLDLGPDTSITGLVDEMFAAGSRQTSTPPRQPEQFPADLETQDGVPLGRTHHAERAIKHHAQENHVVEPPYTHTHTPPFPIHATATSPPLAPSTPTHHNRKASSSFASPPLGRSTHPERVQLARLEEEEIDKDVRMLPESPSPVKPRAGARTRSRSNDDEDSDDDDDDDQADGLVPKFELPMTEPGYPAVKNTNANAGADPFTLPSLKDEPLPQDESMMSMISTGTTEYSEVNISALEKELGNGNDRLMNTSMEASPITNQEASFTRTSSPAPSRRSPLPPIPNGAAISMSPRGASPSPLSPRASPIGGSHRGASPSVLAPRGASPLLPRTASDDSPNGARPRITRDDVQRRLFRPKSSPGGLGGSPNRTSRSPGSPSSPIGLGASPKTSNGILRPSGDSRQRIVDLSVGYDLEYSDETRFDGRDLGREKGVEKDRDVASFSTPTIEATSTAVVVESDEKRKMSVVNGHRVVEQHDPVETEVSVEVTMDVSMCFNEDERKKEDLEDDKEEERGGEEEGEWAGVSRDDGESDDEGEMVDVDLGNFDSSAASATVAAQAEEEAIEVSQATELRYARNDSFSGSEVDSRDEEEDSKLESSMDDEDLDLDEEEFGLLQPPTNTTNSNSNSASNSKDGSGGLTRASSTKKQLKFDFGSKFGLGKLGFSGMGLSAEDLMEDLASTSTTTSTAVTSTSTSTRTTHSTSDTHVQKMPVGSVNVRMDMRSALDRLMDDIDVAGGGGSMDMQKRQASGDVFMADSSFTPPPPLPPKDNIRTREAVILESRRRRRLEDDDDDDIDDDNHDQKEGEDGEDKDAEEDKAMSNLEAPIGRPSRRRSMSTGDADDLGGGARRRGVALRGYDSNSKLELELDRSPSGSDDPLSDTIEKELLKKRKNRIGEGEGEGTGEKKKKKYLIREHKGTIYASSDVSHMAGPGDVNAGKAWRTVRRPSDMNEYSKQIKEFRAQEKPGKAYGKVFVKVLGVKGLVVPMPETQTAVSCTLNNGIHFVTTPDFRLGKDCKIEQEFELIEHSKLEFTLTLKVRRDPHIIAQFKAVVPPLPPQPPPMVSNPSSTSTNKSSGMGMRSFFHSSPKKNKDKHQVNTPPAPPPPILPPPRLTENLARYLKPDGTLARAFVSFKDIVGRCDTRLFETTFPLIGQRAEVGNKASTLQVGELVLQMFRLPPLPGLPPDELPQSLEECHRGLRHVNWHKMTYFEGTLTQNGGDCSSWRRRQLRIIGSNLVAFNDITKRVTATISLRNAITVEDSQDPHKGARSPASGTSRYNDEYDGLFGVERSFRLVFPTEEILFFADTDEEKNRWLEVLRALVGHIPPHPLWAELLWQRQEDLNKSRKGQPQPAAFGYGRQA